MRNIWSEMSYHKFSCKSPQERLHHECSTAYDCELIIDYDMDMYEYICVLECLDEEK